MNLLAVNNAAPRLAVAADVDSTQPAARIDSIGLVSAMGVDAARAVNPIIKIDSVHDVSPPIVAVSTSDSASLYRNLAFALLQAVSSRRRSARLWSLMVDV